MSVCGKWAFLHPSKGVRPFYCGSASCHRERCRKMFWYRRVQLIQGLILEHSLTRFFTLTLDRNKVNPLVDPWDYVHECWSKFRKRMRRKFSGFKFVAVLESHKNKKWPHVHGFCNKWMHQRQWSTMWSQCGGGPIVWVEAVEDENLSEYVNKQLNVAKYVGKQQLIDGYKGKKKHRTLWRTEGLKTKQELEKGEEWDIVKEEVFDDERVRPFFQSRLGVDPYGKKK